MESGLWQLPLGISPPNSPFPAARAPTNLRAMKRVLSWLILSLLVLGLYNPSSVEAADTKPPGIAAAETLSQVTGIAISPLMGVGTVGAYRYFQTPAPQRANLSWYAQPWFWGPALLIVGLCFLKDALGPAVPTALKKPFDIVEVFENKLSGLVATGAIVPMALDMFRTFAPETQAGLESAGFAALDLSRLWGALMVPFALLVYGIVFIVSHTINILILISPFASVDAALKAFRLFLLSTVAGTSFLSPKLGALWAALIILCCVPLAGWALRLAIFGHVFAWDLLTFARTRTRVGSKPSVAFLARKVAGVPRRTYGTVRRDEAGNLTFTYRRWMVLPPRTITLPQGSHAIGRGVLHPELLITEGESSEDILDFPPRYNTHEDALAAALNLREVRPVGLRAAIHWLKSLLGFGPALPEPTTSPA